MRQFLKSLLVSASIVSVGYFVWWGCFPPDRPCFNTLDEVPTLVVQLEDSDRGPNLFIRTFDCYEPEAGLEVTVNGTLQEGPFAVFDIQADASALLGAEPVDLVLVLRDTTATWNIEVRDYLQKREFIARETSTTVGAPLTLDWSGNVLPSEVTALVTYSDASTQTVEGATNVLTVTPPAQAPLGAAELRITAVLDRQLVDRCDGPLEECIVEPTFVTQNLSFEVVAP